MALTLCQPQDWLSPTLTVVGLLCCLSEHRQNDLYWLYIGHRSFLSKKIYFAIIKFNILSPSPAELYSTSSWVCIIMAGCAHPGRAAHLLIKRSLVHSPTDGSTSPVCSLHAKVFPGKILNPEWLLMCSSECEWVNNMLYKALWGLR